MQEKVLKRTEDLSPYCPVFPMQKLYTSKSARHELKGHSFHEESDRSTQALCSCTNSENMTPLPKYDRSRVQALTKRAAYAQKT